MIEKIAALSEKVQATKDLEARLREKEEALAKMTTVKPQEEEMKNLKSRVDKLSGPIIEEMNDLKNKVDKLSSPIIDVQSELLATIHRIKEAQSITTTINVGFRQSDKK